MLLLVAPGYITVIYFVVINIFSPLNAELNPICHLLALLGAHHILHVSRMWVNSRLQKICPYPRRRIIWENGGLSPPIPNFDNRWR